MKIQKSDFKKISLNQGKHYFQYKSKNAFGVEIEIDLEPTVSGFCVAVYGGVPDILGPSLLEPKIDVEDPALFDVFGLIPRPARVWDKALEIANQFLTAYRVNTK